MSKSSLTQELPAAQGLNPPLVQQQVVLPLMHWPPQEASSSWGQQAWADPSP